MDKALQLDIVTPDKVVLSRQADYVSAPGVEGEFGVLPGHIPLLSALVVGTLSYTADGKKHSAFVGGGFAEVSNDKITILAESAELAEHIDAARAIEARKRAEDRLRQHAEGVNEERANAALKRAVTRLNIHGAR